MKKQILSLVLLMSIITPMCSGSLNYDYQGEDSDFYPEDFEDGLSLSDDLGDGFLAADSCFKEGAFSGAFCGFIAGVYSSQINEKCKKGYQAFAKLTFDTMAQVGEFAHKQLDKTKEVMKPALEKGYQLGCEQLDKTKKVMKPTLEKGYQLGCKQLSHAKEISLVVAKKAHDQALVAASNVAEYNKILVSELKKYGVHASDLIKVGAITSLNNVKNRPVLAAVGGLYYGFCAYAFLDDRKTGWQHNGWNYDRVKTANDKIVQGLATAACATVGALLFSSDFFMAY